jgi:hypothetical protein
MASHGDASGSRVNECRDGRTTSGRVITHAQIRQAIHVYTSEIPLSLHPTEDELAALRFIVSEPATYKEAMMGPHSVKWLQDMKSEIESMYENQVWSLVDLS